MVFTYTEETFNLHEANWNLYTVNIVIILETYSFKTIIMFIKENEHKPKGLLKMSIQIEILEILEIVRNIFFTV